MLLIHYAKLRQETQRSEPDHCKKATTTSEKGKTPGRAGSRDIEDEVSPNDEERPPKTLQERRDRVRRQILTLAMPNDDSLSEPECGEVDSDA